MKVHVAAKNYKDETEIINGKEYAKFDIVCRIYDYPEGFKQEEYFTMGYMSMYGYMKYKYNQEPYVGFEVYEIRLLGG